MKNITKFGLEIILFWVPEIVKNEDLLKTLINMGGQSSSWLMIFLELEAQMKGGGKKSLFYHFLMFSNDFRAFVKFCNFWRIDSQTDVQIVVDSKLSVGFWQSLPYSS